MTFEEVTQKIKTNTIYYDCEVLLVFEYVSVGFSMKEIDYVGLPWFNLELCK